MTEPTLQGQIVCCLLQEISIERYRAEEVAAELMPIIGREYAVLMDTLRRLLRYASERPLITDHACQMCGAPTEEPRFVCAYHTAVQMLYG